MVGGTILEKIGWGGLVSGLFGVLTYAGKKYLDSKIKKATVGQIEVIRKQYIDRFDTLVRLNGILAEIDHCLEHVRNGNERYEELNKEWCMKARHEARLSIALVGQRLVDAIHLATDAAIDYTSNHSAEAFALWKRRLAETYNLSRIDIAVQR